MDCFGYLGLQYGGHMARTRGCMSSSHIYARKIVEKERLLGISQTLPDSGGGLDLRRKPMRREDRTFQSDHGPPTAFGASTEEERSALAQETPLPASQLVQFTLELIDDPLERFG